MCGFGERKRQSGHMWLCLVRLHATDRRNLVNAHGYNYYIRRRESSGTRAMLARGISRARYLIGIVRYRHILITVFIHIDLNVERR